MSQATAEEKISKAAAALMAANDQLTAENADLTAKLAAATGRLTVYEKNATTFNGKVDEAAKAAHQAAYFDTVTAGVKTLSDHEACLNFVKQAAADRIDLAKQIETEKANTQKIAAAAAIDAGGPAPTKRAWTDSPLRTPAGGVSAVREAFEAGFNR